MKKLLALIGVTSLVMNSGIAGIVLLKNEVQDSINKKLLVEVPDVDKIDQSNSNNNIKSENEQLLDELIKLASQSYSSPIEIIEQILPYLNNKMLSNDFIVKIIESVLKGLKSSTPEIGQYLSYLNFGPEISMLASELANNWDQQSEHGTTPLDAMRSFINSNKGNIAQAKTVGNKGQWYYVDVRATSWDWNGFYQYMAGANLNYMIKVLTNGSYIGNLIDNHLYLGPFNWGFDKDAFLNDISSAVQKLPTTKAAWPYLIKTIIPLLKTKVLNTLNPTLGFKNLTWETKGDKNLSLKSLLTQVKYLLSPAGRNDLVGMFASLLSGPFGEDIIINCGMLGYYTFTELLEVVNNWPISWIVGDGLKPRVLAEGIVTALTEVTDGLSLRDIFDSLYYKIDAGLNSGATVDLQDLASDLNKLYQTDNFQTGLDQLIDLIENPNTTQSSLKEIFALWGTQKNEANFKIDSPLFIIKKWVDDPNSILSQILNVLRNLEKSEPYNLDE